MEFHKEYRKGCKAHRGYHKDLCNKEHTNGYILGNDDHVLGAHNGHALAIPPVALELDEDLDDSHQADGQEHGRHYLDGDQRGSEAQA